MKGVNLTDWNRDMKFATKISEYLEANKVYNVSEHFIMSHIKQKYDSSLTTKENCKNIAREIIKERILSKRRNILIHSCIYYKLNTNVIQDFEYDKLCNDLVWLQERFPKIAEETPLHNIFKDWGNEETTSGYNLPISNPKVIERAMRIVKINEWYKTHGQA